MTADPGIASAAFRRLTEVPAEEFLRRFAAGTAVDPADLAGATYRGWNDDDLNQLKTVPGRAFEVVATGRINH